MFFSYKTMSVLRWGNRKEAGNGQNRTHQRSNQNPKPTSTKTKHEMKCKWVEIGNCKDTKTRRRSLQQPERCCGDFCKPSARKPQYKYVVPVDSVGSLPAKLLSQSSTGSLWGKAFASGPHTDTSHLLGYAEPLI